MFLEISFFPAFDVDNQRQKVKCAQTIGVNNFKYISFSQSVPNPRTSLNQRWLLNGDAKYMD